MRSNMKDAAPRLVQESQSQKETRDGGEAIARSSLASEVVAHHTGGSAFEVIVIIPSAADPPGAPRHVVLFPAVGVAGFPACTPITLGGGGSVLRKGRPRQRGIGRDDGSANKCKSGHIDLL